MSFSFPDAERLVPRYVDIPLGPTDRLHSWLGWTIEADPLFGSPAKMLRNEDGTLLYGDDGQVAYGSHGEPIVLITDDESAGELWNDGGVLALIGPVGWPSSPAGLPPGAVWNNGLAIAIVPGGVLAPSARLFFPGVTAAQLLWAGGTGLPLTKPLNVGQLWNNGGEIAVSDGLPAPFTLDQSVLDGPDVLA